MPENIQEGLFTEYKGAFDEEVDSELKLAMASKQKGNFFALPDAVGQKNAKKAWIEYIKARTLLLEPEMLHGSIVAKVRDMLFSERASAGELEMHPFVYKKAKQDFNNWNREELQKLYYRLIFIHYQSRSGGDELDLALEKLLLSI